MIKPIVAAANPASKALVTPAFSTSGSPGNHPSRDRLRNIVVSQKLNLRLNATPTKSEMIAMVRVRKPSILREVTRSALTGHPGKNKKALEDRQVHEKTAVIFRLSARFA
jgi:hypothetical protein